MNDILSHRGPDDSGYFALNSSTGWKKHFGDEDSKVDLPNIQNNSHEFDLYFGHRRLAIIGVDKSGHQPFSYKDRYHLVYNGEIYNYLELKDLLKSKGYHFHTQTDTEVIPAAFHEWGVQCLNMFNGMWSFILYDSELNRLFISRDRFGIKPLYYARVDSSISFASEIKSFRAIEGYKLKVNDKYCNEFIAKGAKEFSSTTAFEGVVRVEPNSYFLGSIEDLFSNRLAFKSFWNLDINNSLESPSAAKMKDYSGQLGDLLYDSVKIRLRSDVSIGSALSGGLDSSIIVSLANRMLIPGQKQVTFSSVYPNDKTGSYDESKFIDIMEQHFSVDSKRIEPRFDEVLKDHKKLIYHFDTPPDLTMISSWNTFKLVKQNDVVVTLDGQGADEILGGYSRYFINHLLYSSDSINEEQSLFVKNGFKVPNKRRIQTLYFLRRIGLIPLMRYSFRNRLNSFLTLNERLYRDLFTNLGNLLHYSDRTSMAFNVESRVPFLDYRLVEFVMSIPGSYKIHNGWNKFIARKTFETSLPSEIAWRKGKIGWAIPERGWFNGPLHEPSLEIINTSGFQKLERQEAIELKNRDFDKYIRLLNLAVWKDTFINN